MIPIALLVGLAVGHWWLVAIAACGWALALVATGVAGLEGAVAGAALAAANAAVGVAFHKCIAAAVRLARNSSR